MDGMEELNISQDTSTLYTTKTSSQLGADWAVCLGAVFGFYGSPNVILCL